VHRSIRHSDDAASARFAVRAIKPMVAARVRVRAGAGGRHASKTKSEKWRFSMRVLFASLAVSAAMLVTPALAAGPSYENGAVWDFAQIKSKDGHFDEYMKWLSTSWKVQQEALKKAGYITDYKVFVVADPRGDDPDIVLATEYKNMAAMDTTVAESYAFAEKTMGPLEKTSKEQADRGAIRSLMGDVLTREVVLK
jgi:hypothetical protein